MPRSTRLVVLLAIVAVPTAASACLWDDDTIKMERVRLPDTLELITGKFLRHSPEFYQWRIADRLKRLEADPSNAALLDDLAVAYDKTGQHDKAIETARRTEVLHPGRYETAANIATFLFHADRIEESIPHIDRALAINPDAHFGRERYQKWLAEYVVKQRNGGPLRLPLAEANVYPPNTFEHYMLVDQLWEERWNQRKAAIIGVLGMMRFANHESPILLEALGSLLVQHGNDPAADAKLLAARAYLKASYEMPDGPMRAAYRKMAEQAIRMQTAKGGGHEQISLERVEADFQRELDDARTWYADLRERELSWIREGKNPEAEFDRLYATEPQVPGLGATHPLSLNEKIGLAAVAVAVAAILGVVLLQRRRRKTRRDVEGPHLRVTEP